MTIKLETSQIVSLESHSLMSSNKQCTDCFSSPGLIYLHSILAFFSTVQADMIHSLCVVRRHTKSAILMLTQFTKMRTVETYCFAAKTTRILCGLFHYRHGLRLRLTDSACADSFRMHHREKVVQGSHSTTGRRSIIVDRFCRGNLFQTLTTDGTCTRTRLPLIGAPFPPAQASRVGLVVSGRNLSYCLEMNTLCLLSMGLQESYIDDLLGCQRREIVRASATQ